MTDVERRTKATERIERRKEARAKRLEEERRRARPNWTPLFAAIIFVILAAAGFFAYTQGMLPIPPLPAGKVLPPVSSIEYVWWIPPAGDWFSNASWWQGSEVLWQPYWL